MEYFGFHSYAPTAVENVTAGINPLQMQRGQAPENQRVEADPGIARRALATFRT